MEILGMLIKTKNQIIQDLIEKLKQSHDYESDQSQQSQDEDCTGYPSTELTNTADDALGNSCPQTATKDALHRSAGFHERQWLKKRNTQSP